MLMLPESFPLTSHDGMGRRIPTFDGSEEGGRLRCGSFIVDLYVWWMTRTGQ